MDRPHVGDAQKGDVCIDGLVDRSHENIRDLEKGHAESMSLQANESG